MNLAIPVAGYFLAVLIIMFGGRKRRSFAHANHAAAGMTVALFCLGAITWLLILVISHIMNAEN